MTKTKSTKRALLMSALSLLMCVSMLIGSTFAWFTDSVTSGSNVIKSGNLDITVEYTLDGENWKELDGVTDLFQKGLWEPGHTEVVALRIKNNGSLALKYVATMNIFNETVGKTADGKDIVLSDLLTVSTLTQQTGAIGDIAVALAFDGENRVEYETTTSFKAANVLKENKELLSGDAHYMIIKVNMPETIGNEANHNGVNVPSIEFGINVLATQYNYENDSFGNDYDSNAPAVEVIVDSTEELEKALADGKKIIGVEGTSVELAAARAGQNRDMGHVTLVGVTDDATITVTGTGGGLDNLNLKDIKVVDSTFYTSENGENAWEFTYLELGGTATYTNVVFEDGVMSNGSRANFVNCTFNGHNNDSSAHGNVTMYGAWVYNGEATFTNCSFVGTRGLKVCDQYAGEASNVLVDNCVFGPLSEKPGLAIDDRDAKSFNIVIKNSFFINCQAGDQSNYIYETDNYTPVLENNKVFNNATVVASAEEFIAATNGGLVVITDDIVYTNTDPSKQMIMEAVNAIEFNGNGATITTQGADPSVGNHGYVAFVPAAGQNVTVTDVTITGEGFVEMGDYSIGGGNYVANNLVVKDLVSTLANGDKGKTLACGFAHYGNAELNNCTMTGTTAMIDGAMAVDAGFVNGTTTVVNGGEYGTVYCWSHAKVTINGAEVDTLYVSPINGNVTVKAGTHIATLNVDYGTSSANATRLAKLVIEDGATVDAIVFNGTSYTVAEWNAYLATL